jgi:hypothetical protein
MYFSRKILIAIEKTTRLTFGCLLLVIFVFLALSSRSIRSILIFWICLYITVVASSTIGVIIAFLSISICVAIGFGLYQIGSQSIAAWRMKSLGSTTLALPSSSSDFSDRPRSIGSQLRIDSQRSRDERLSIVTQSIETIRARTPNLSIQDLYDLNRLNLELQQIIDEASWSPARRARVARIAEIRNSRQATGQTLPSGLIDREENSEITISFEYETFDSGQIWSDNLEGIGDLTCQYNARSLLIRCAVYPTATTCEGCRDYQPDETLD